MAELKILLKEDSEFLYFKVNRCLLEGCSLDALEEGEEIGIEIPAITKFILDELDLCECLKDIAINEDSIIISQKEATLSIDLIKKVRKIIERCFHIEELLSRI